MYAIILCGGKQYKAQQGDILEVEKLRSEPGDKIELDVLMTVDGDKVNTDVKAKLEAEVLSHNKAKKVVVYKYKAKKNVRKKKGHRQPYTRIKIGAM